MTDDMSIIDWCKEEAGRRHDDPELRAGLLHVVDYMTFVQKAFYNQLDKVKIIKNERDKYKMGLKRVRGMIDSLAVQAYIDQILEQVQCLDKPKPPDLPEGPPIELIKEGEIKRREKPKCGMCEDRGTVEASSSPTGPTEDVIQCPKCKE